MSPRAGFPDPRACAPSSAGRSIELRQLDPQLERPPVEGVVDRPIPGNIETTGRRSMAWVSASSMGAVIAAGEPAGLPGTISDQQGGPWVRECPPMSPER